MRIGRSRSDQFHKETARVTLDPNASLARLANRLRRNMTQKLGMALIFQRLFKIASGGLLGFALAGCGALVTGRAWLTSDEVKPNSDDVVVIGEVRTAPAKENANRFALMALFAKIVYRKDLPPEKRGEQSCSYLTKTEPLTLGMPRRADGSGWKRWKGTSEASACVSKDGLAYETYVHEDSAGNLDEAVIAFRGTENYNVTELLDDWSTNFAAALGVEPSEFVTAQKLVPNVIKGLKTQFPSIRIYATGHSLGGGLAQQAGYMSSDVLEVYAFNPSPVTNWSFLKLRDLIDKTDPTIFRVYHWHEGLAYVRNVTSRFNSRRFGRSDYEFYFQKDQPVAVHEMGILACHLAKLIQGEEAAHSYPKSFADFVISPEYKLEGFYEHPVCPASVRL